MNRRPVIIRKKNLGFEGLLGGNQPKIASPQPASAPNAVSPPSLKI